MGGGAILLRTHEFRKWTAGPTSSALGRPNAWIRRALCYVWAAATPVWLVMRSLPRKKRPEQRKPHTYFCSLCFFQGDSRSPPDFARHSKAIKRVMRLWLRLFFPSFLTPCLRFLYYLFIMVIQAVVWWVVGDSLGDTRVPEMDRRADFQCPDRASCVY